MVIIGLLSSVSSSMYNVHNCVQSALKAHSVDAKEAITSKIKHAIKRAIELKTESYKTCTTVAALISILF